MKHQFIAGVVFTAISVALLGACGDDSVAIKSGQVQSNPLEPRYQATLSEGITFKNPGYPSFINGVKGISVQEDFGRWTDGTEAAIEFTQPLPKKFTLKITATSYQPSMGNPIEVVIGGKKYQTEFPKHWDFKEVAISVVTSGDAKSIVFNLPNAKVPKLIGQGEDGRKLSIALANIKIIEQ